LWEGLTDEEIASKYSVKTYTDSEWAAKLAETGNQGKDILRPVGTAFVLKGQFRSYNSKDEADELAREYAYTLLNCIYNNDPVNVECQRDENG
jgi:hypothetical protein